MVFSYAAALGLQYRAPRIGLRDGVKSGAESNVEKPTGK
jgi:hypothetical protein